LILTTPNQVEFDGLYVKGSGVERETEEKLGVTLKEKEAAEEVKSLGSRVEGLGFRVESVTPKEKEAAKR